MDEDVDWTFEGNSECDMCGAMAGTTDSRPIPGPHENCGCTSTPTCRNSYSFSGSSTRYGPGGNCFTFNPTVIVTCWDGTQIQYEMESIDFGCNTGADYDGSWEESVWDQVTDEACDMAEGCPDCAPKNVS